MGLPPLLKFGSKDLQERFCPDFLLGKKRICLAITEPEAGSDVANIQTTTEKTGDGKEYIVNGTKKWYVAALLGLDGLAYGSQDHEWHLVRLRYNGCPHLRPWTYWPLSTPRTAPQPPRRHYAPS